MIRSSKLPKDVNQRAAEIARLSTEEPNPPEKQKPPEAVSEYLSQIGHRGGVRGGRGRATKLTKKRRQEIARRAALARWKKEKG
jgi:hypothetical protein